MHTENSSLIHDFRWNIPARDILNTLIDVAAVDVDNFNWISQLRYYWKYDDIGMPD